MTRRIGRVANKATSFFAIAISIVTGVLHAWLTPDAAAAEKPDSHARVFGHYVHMKAYGMAFTGDAGAASLREQHRLCVDLKKRAGQPFVSEPSGGWPKQQTPRQIETYYTRTRTILIYRGEHYFPRLTDCEIVAAPIHGFTLQSGAGACMVDLVKKTALGQCDEAAHRRATSPFPTSTIGSPFVTKGPERAVLGMQCTPYTGARREVCIANPRSEFSIPNSPAGRAAPGLLLEEHGTDVNGVADVVRLHVDIPEAVFAIPSGLKYTHVPGPVPVAPRAGGK